MPQLSACPGVLLHQAVVLPTSHEALSSNHGSCHKDMAAYPDPDDVVAPTTEEEAGRAVQSQHAASVASQHPAKRHPSGCQPRHRHLMSLQ